MACNAAAVCSKKERDRQRLQDVLRVSVVNDESSVALNLSAHD